MRILRLDIGESKKRVEMHPLVTVIQRLEQADGVELVQHIRSLARGSAVGVSGLIEDQANLISLEGRGTIALSHVTTVDVVVEADTTQVATAATAALQAEIDQLQRQSDIDAALVEEIRAQLDPAAKSRLAELRRDLYSLTGSEQLSNSRQNDVEAALHRAGLLDPFVLKRPPKVEEAMRLWAAYQAFLRQHESHVQTLSAEMAAATSSVEACRSALEEAENMAVPVILTSQEEARLDELEERRSERGWDSGSVEAREMEALLSKADASSWTAYSMQRLNPTVSSEKLEAVQQRRLELAEEQKRSALAHRSLNSDPTVTELELRRSAALAAAAEVFDANDLPADIGASLANLEGQQQNPEWVQAQSDLLNLIQRPEFGAPAELGIESAQEWATAWLESPTDAASQQRSAEEQIRGEIVAVERALGRHNRAMEQIGRIEERAQSSNHQIGRILEAREAAQASGVHHTAELLSYIRCLTNEALWEASQAVPVAITGSLENIDIPELMSSLELLAQNVQVVVVSDNPSLAQWASSVGEHRALLVTPSEQQIPSS